MTSAIIELLILVNPFALFIYLNPIMDDLASEIALPFMVGACSVTIAVRMGYNYVIVDGLSILGAVIIINLLIILLLKLFKDIISRKRLKVAYDKNINFMMRLNGFSFARSELI